MKLLWVLAMISTIAFSSERVLELCQHHSGFVHNFSGSRCDGEHEHSQDHGKHHESDEENHPEKHEPCHHVYLQVDDGAKAPVSEGLLTPIPNYFVLTSTRFESDSWVLVRSARATINIKRGPPGARTPTTQFQETICLRL